MFNTASGEVYLVRERRKGKKERKRKRSGKGEEWRCTLSEGGRDKEV